MEEVTVSQSVSEENSLVKLKRYKKNVEWTNSLLETQQMLLYTKISVALSSFTRAKKKKNSYMHLKVVPFWKPTQNVVHSTGRISAVDRKCKPPTTAANRLGVVWCEVCVERKETQRGDTEK